MTPTQLENIKSLADTALQDLHDEKNRGLALLEDAKHWQAELWKAEANNKHLGMERDDALRQVEILQCALKGRN